MRDKIGYIEVNRNIIDDNILKLSPNAFRLYYCMLAMCNFKDSNTIKKNQILTSQNELALESGMSVGSVKNWLSYLECKNYIEKIEKDNIKNHGTIIELKQMFGINKNIESVGHNIAIGLNGSITECPTEVTECPTEVTECPTEVTECPTEVTECPRNKNVMNVKNDIMDLKDLEKEKFDEDDIYNEEEIHNQKSLTEGRKTNRERLIEITSKDFNTSKSLQDNWEIILNTIGIKIVRQDYDSKVASDILDIFSKLGITDIKDSIINYVMDNLISERDKYSIVKKQFPKNFQYLSGIKRYFKIMLDNRNYNNITQSLDSTNQTIQSIKSLNTNNNGYNQKQKDNIVNETISKSRKYCDRILSEAYSSKKKITYKQFIQTIIFSKEIFKALENQYKKQIKDTLEVKRIIHDCIKVSEINIKDIKSEEDVRNDLDIVFGIVNKELVKVLK